jgi:hypothetical protein
MRRPLATVALVCLVALAGCGGSDGDDAAETTPTATQAKVDFPRGAASLRGLRQSLPEGPVLAPAVSQLEVGENRIGFALFDVAQETVSPEAVAIYTADSNGSNLEGPFVARRESLQVKPQFQSRQTAADADEIDSFWVADVPFESRGARVVTALAQLDGEMVASSQVAMRVTDGRGGPPRVGERAIRIDTPTPADVGGDLSQISTRIPPLRELHETSFSDVLGREPVVLTFSTPQLCQTRVCGPVVDVVAQVAAGHPDVTFIHQEIYRDNELSKGFRPQVAAWRLPTEPWTFVVGRDGRIVERFEGALSAEELERAVGRLQS